MVNDTTQKSPRRYENMRDSGVEWIGMIPGDWETKRLKFLGVARNGLTYSPADISDKSSGTLVIRSSNIQNGKLQFQDNVYVKSIIPQDLMLHQGDIVICARNGSKSLIGKSAYVDSSISATFGAFMMVFRTSVFEKKYIYWLLNSGIFNYYLGAYSTTTINQLTRENINNMYVPFCPLPMLRSSISNFLDEKCKQIDTVITEVKLSINAYNSWKSSIIYEAVTKGLNPSVKMKDSGIAWVGKIPAHWKIGRVKNCFINHDEWREPIRAENRENKLKLYDYYGASGPIDKIDFFNVDDTVLLIGEDGANLRMRNLPLVYKASGKFWVNNHAHILKVKEPNSYDFMAYLLEAGDYNEYITGSAQPKLSQFNLMRYPIPLVPPREQKEIETYLNRRCSKIDEIIEEKKALISDLESYKKSLIFEVVTGKRKVV